MRDRLKVLRKSLKLSQAKFGEKLGVSRDAINDIENGRAEIKPLMVNHVCLVFGISENWLQTGEGEMHVQTDSALIEELATEYKMSEKQKKIIATFAAMDEKKREVLAEAFFEFVDALASSSEVSATIATRPAANDTKLTVEQKRHIVMNELPNEEKGQISSVSTTSNGSDKKLA